MRLNKNLKFLQSTADIQSTDRMAPSCMATDLAITLPTGLLQGRGNQMPKLWFMPAKYDIKT